MIHIGGKTYELVQENKNGYNFEAFRDRFSEVLERYDYIVGDWGYSQLRLKGFFKESNKNGNKDTCVSGIHDYLNEYCNFGCAYFILRKVNGAKPQTEPGAQQAPSESQQQPNAAGPKQTSPGTPQQQPHPRPERHERHERPARQERQQPTK
ncbi:DUF1027 domain-containing protein [Paenibacillus hemerocallicola]|uniref:DUF1027 domain-containing protein n=1 Tax=Paenibacillus hemerocallicola TaxID=1172614 RepID=A0A5C4T6G0_9BACL|nr:YutD family protein [Paenibacillus hemerocallicola]TNJ64641.1 DUF1027 domain-containing protein [Paenibacillus hemerocallicola]